MDDPGPHVAIKLRTRSRCLELEWADGRRDALQWEYLRVQSPSAEVRGHGPGQRRLQHGKRDVRITRIDPVGNYALKLVFSDGHDSGLYSWRYLRQLADEHGTRWQAYLDELEAAGRSRDAGADPG